MKILRSIALLSALFYSITSFGMQEEMSMTRERACAFLKLNPAVEHDQKAVVKAFRLEALQWHPDKHVYDTDALRERAKKIYTQVQQARDFLMNPSPIYVEDVPQGDIVNVSSMVLLDHRNLEQVRQQLIGKDAIRLVIDFPADLTGREKAQAMEDLYTMIANASSDTKVKVDQLSGYIRAIEFSAESFAIDTVENSARSIESFSKIIDICEHIEKPIFTNKTNIRNQYIRDIKIMGTFFNFSRTILADRLHFYASKIRIDSVSKKSICGRAVIVGAASLVPYIMSTLAVVAINGYLLKHYPKFYNNFFYSAHTTYGNLRVGAAITFLTGFGFHVGKAFGIKVVNNFLYSLPDDQFQGNLYNYGKIGLHFPMHVPTIKESIFGDSVKKASLNILLNSLKSVCVLAPLFSYKTTGRIAMYILLANMQSRLNCTDADHGIKANVRKITISAVLYPIDNLLSRLFARYGIFCGARAA